MKLNKSDWKKAYRQMRVKGLNNFQSIFASVDARYDIVLRDLIPYVRHYQSQFSGTPKMLHRTINKRPMNQNRLPINFQFNKRKIELYKEDVMDDRMTRLKRK